MEVAKFTKNKVETKLGLHLDRFKRMMQSQLIPLMQMNVNSRGMLELCEKNDLTRGSRRALPIPKYRQTR